MIKLLLASLVITILSIGVIACGSAGKSATSASQASSTGSTPTKSSSTATSSSSSTTTPASTTPRVLNDADDGDILTTVDKHDDNEVVEYGSAASPADNVAATTFIKQYYKAARVADGAALCSLVVSKLAKSIPKNFGKSSSPPYLRGKSCAEIMTKLYRYNHKRMSTGAAGFKVTGVRVNGNKAYVLLAFTTMREPRFIFVEREGGAWKMSEELLDSPYP